MKLELIYQIIFAIYLCKDKLNDYMFKITLELTHSNEFCSITFSIYLKINILESLTENYTGCLNSTAQTKSSEMCLLETDITERNVSRASFL